MFSSYSSDRARIQEFFKLELQRQLFFFLVLRLMKAVNSHNYATRCQMFAISLRPRCIFQFERSGKTFNILNNRHVVFTK